MRDGSQRLQESGRAAGMAASASRERGVGLVELMVTLVIMGVVLVAVFSTFFRTSDQTRRMTHYVDARQNARLAIQLIERDTRMAGSGWGRARVFMSSSGVPASFYGLNPGYGGAMASDSLELTGAWSTETTLRTSMPNPSAIIKVLNAAGFQDSDLCVITNGASTHLFQITHVDLPAGTLQHNPDSPFNVPGGFSNWPATGYGSGAQVFKITRVTYRLDTLSYGRPCLVRQEFGHPPQVAAWDVDRFQVRYRLQDGSETRNPTQITNVDRVKPVLVVRVDEPRRPAWFDSCTADVRPRTF